MVILTYKTFHINQTISNFLIISIQSDSLVLHTLYLGAGCLQPLWRAELWRCIISPNRRSVSYLLSTTTMNNELIEKLQKLLAEGKGEEFALLREALIQKSLAKASGDKS